jgi:hypothetical protein
MVKENNKTTIKSNKSNNSQIVKYIPRTISQIQIPHIIQISQIPLIPLVPNLYHFYLSINKFFVKNKIYYQFYYYVLNNNQIDIIPNKKICPDNNIDSIHELTYKTSSIYIYNISNTELFKKLDLMNCKIRISIISVDLDSTENIFIKFFNEKNIFINEKNLELVKFNKNNSTDELDKLDNLFNNITI